MKAPVSQFLRYSPVAVSALVLGHDRLNFFFQFCVLVWLFLLLRVVIICAARETGDAVAYGIFGVQDRGVMFVSPGVPVYAGMVVGETPKLEDITVNVCKKKQLTNMRAAGSDEALRLVPPRIMSLEQCLEFLADDELLEVTPSSLRIRKSILDHSLRMKALKGKKDQ